MENKHDSRPFIDLQKDAEEFRTKFEEDIEKCKSLLDAKITSLIRDPDSLGNSIGPKQNALVEFSKAKYDVYISMKSLMNEMEREWLKYISEMKKLFIDNVEVFLANTKLEVKLPPSGSLLSPGPRRSLGSKSAAIAGSLYPIISNITKSIPGFTQKNKSLEMERNEDETMLSSESEISSDEDKAIEKSYSPYNSKHRKTPSPLKQKRHQSPLNIANLPENEDEEINEPKQYVPEIPSRYSRNGRFTDQKRTVDDVPEIPSRYSRKGRFTDQKRTADDVPEIPSRYSRKGRFTDQKRTSDGIYLKDAEDVSSSENQEDTSEYESELTLVNSRKSNRLTSRSKSAAISKKKSNNSDNKETMETETINNEKDESSKTYKRKQASKSRANTKGETSRLPGRPSRRKTINETVVERETSLSPKTGTFTAEHDIADDLDTEIYVPQPSKSITRRKTLLPNAKAVLSGTDIIPGNRTSARSKRKTISGVSDLASVAPSKRLKSSNIQKMNNMEDEDAVAEVNHLESSDNYSEWISLKSIDGKTPTSPGIYEVKVWRAKKSAYIGFCDSLRQKLTLHKVKQNSGHKHLDKFIERNYDDIQIRYEVVPSVNDAKVEVKNRVNSFVALHKTTPAYN